MSNGQPAPADPWAARIYEAAKFLLILSGLITAILTYRGTNQNGAHLEQQGQVLDDHTAKIDKAASAASEVKAKLEKKEGMAP